jgi:hypothetical protein
MSEAELIEAMHTGWAAPDGDDYTYDAPPELVRPAEVAALLAGEEEVARLRQENMTLSELAADRARIIVELEAIAQIVKDDYAAYCGWCGSREISPLHFDRWLDAVRANAKAQP